MSKNYNNNRKFNDGATEHDAATSEAMRLFQNTSKDERREMAKKHNALMNQVFLKETFATAENAHEYQDGDMFDYKAESRSEEPNITCISGDIVTIAENAKKDNPDAKVCLHDFASFFAPGGGYLNGARTQEEQLCAASNLQPILALLADGSKDENGKRDGRIKGGFYRENKNYERGGLHTSHALYLDDVKFINDGNQFDADVLVISAVNRKRALENGRSEKECDNDLVRRVKSALNIAAANNVDVFITGAFGCGAYGNDPEAVAKAYKEWLDENTGAIPTVVFAFVNSGMRKTFNKVILGIDEDEEYAKKQAAKQAEEAQEEIEDEDWRNYMTCTGE